METELGTAKKPHERVVLHAVLRPHQRIWWVQERQGKCVEDSPFAGLLNIQTSHPAWEIPELRITGVQG